MTKIAEVVKATRDYVAKRPHVSYQPAKPGHCEYNSGECSDGTCGCLFGQILPTLGIPTDNELDIAGLLEDYIETEFDETRISWCLDVQGQQDLGHRWDSCINLADMDWPKV